MWAASAGVVAARSVSASILLLRKNLLNRMITKLEEWRMEDALGFPLSRLLERTSLLRDPLLEAFCWVSETYSLKPDTAL